MSTSEAHDLDLSTLAQAAAGEAHDDPMYIPSEGWRNMIEWADEKFKEKEDLTSALRGPLPLPADHHAWRALEAAEISRGLTPVTARRFRPAVPVKTHNIQVSYGEGGKEKYRILVHVPERYPGEGEGLRPAVIWFHGGGWAHGSPELDTHRASYLASELRSLIFSVSYRLIPEFGWKEIHEDCYHSLSYVLQHAEEWGVDRKRVGVWGQSAGAHLGAGVVLRDSVEHNPPRVRQVSLVVPVTFDFRDPPYPLSLAAASELAAMPPLILQQFQQVLEELTGSPKPLKDPYFSPLLSPIPSHHPATHITVAGLDRLRDGGIAYALHLRQHGVDCGLDIVPGVPHAFTGENEVSVTRQFWRDQVRVFEMGLNHDWTK